MKLKYTRKELLQKIDDCKGDMFLAYGYFKMLEELDQEDKPNN